MLLLLGVLHATESLDGSPPSFSRSELAGESSDLPTTLQFGPDGRLYVGQRRGRIYAYTVERRGKDDYRVTATEEILLIRTIQNHNDDGSLSARADRMLTGLLVTGTPANPVLYVSSSNSTVLTSDDKPPSERPDSNSGVISRLRWSGSSWTKIDLVRGLPKQFHDHASNGMALDPATNTLYLGQGANTNMGAPSTTFNHQREYALSGAILAIDLHAIGATTYDLPTLDDEDRPGNPDANDPFGGNGGKNQAILVPGGPVQIWSPGYRNPYDVVLTRAGRLYTIDNGPNGGNGGLPAGCTNSFVDGGETFLDHLHYIPHQGFYGGHPNPTRGSTANTFNASNPQSPVPDADPDQCTYHAPGEDGSLATFKGSTNGIIEYTAANFGGEMNGDLLAANFRGDIYRVRLTASGDSVAEPPIVLFSNFSVKPLDIEALGDSEPFPGTIWVANYGSGTITIFEPSDYGDPGGGTSCTGADDPALDEDGDGYKNADEIDNGTDPCSSASTPPDFDGDLVSNLNDSDDDDDGTPDTADLFPIDPDDGLATPIPAGYSWESDEPDPGGLLDLGFTGLMANGLDWLDLFDRDTVFASGAAGVVTISAIDSGTPRGSENAQRFAFHYGVAVDPSTPPFRVAARILAPFGADGPEGDQAIGFFIGTGSQDDFLELSAVAADGATGIETGREVAGTHTRTFYNTSVLGASQVDLFLDVDPATGTAQPRASVDGGAEVTLGGSIALPSSWFAGASGLAVGIIATTAGGPEFPATWDFLTVTEIVGPPVPSSTYFVRGDVNADSNLDISDPIAILRDLFVGDAAPLVCRKAADVDDSGTLNLSDAIRLLDRLFRGAPPPEPPNACGEDPTPDALACEAFPACSQPDPGGGSSTAIARITVDPDQTGIQNSTIRPGSFQIYNESTAGEKIESVRFDLSTGIFLDMAFDPDGGGGDTDGKCFTRNSDGAVVGFVAPADPCVDPFSAPHDGGFDRMDLSFTDFDPGESFNFTVDVDPTSIRGASPPGPHVTGAVSGLEIIGALITVEFSDGSVHTAALYRLGDTLDASTNLVTADPPAAPTLAVAGVSGTRAMVTQADQTLRVTGPAGASVAILIIEGALYTDGVPGGGFDIDPYETNAALSVAELRQTIGGSGMLDVPVTLVKTRDEGGTFNITATIVEANGRTGMLAPYVILELE